VEDAAAAHQKYVFSHNSYAPGEQKTRAYDWQSTPVDPASFKFGQRTGVSASAASGVAQALNQDNAATVDPAWQAERRSRPLSRVVVSKTEESFRATTADTLGTVRSLGHGEVDLPDGHRYGVPSQRMPEWGAQKCVTGEYSDAEQQPDADLGTSNRPGYRNIPSRAEDKPDVRAYGTPTVRRDISQPEKKSIADNRNFGEKPASALVNPSRFVNYGAAEEDFLLPMPKVDLFTIVASAGILRDGESFDTVFEAANAEFGAVSVQAFRRMLAVSRQ
jgi:hypothetical protein